MYKIFFLFLIFFGCKSPRIIFIEEVSVSKYQPGKCYDALKTNDKENPSAIFQQSFILEAIPPKIVEVEVMYASERFIPLLTDSKMRHQTSETSVKFIIRSKDEFDKSARYEIEYQLCIIEIRREYITITKDDLLGDSIKIIEKKQISESKIVKKYVKNRPRKLKENQLYFDSGYWLERESALKSSCGHNIILEIQQKMIKLGYDIKLTELLDEATKAAIIDFQKQQGLPTGQIDFETIRALGIPY